MIPHEQLLTELLDRAYNRSESSNVASLTPEQRQLLDVGSCRASSLGYQCSRQVRLMSPVYVSFYASDNGFRSSQVLVDEILQGTTISADSPHQVPPQPRYSAVLYLIVYACSELELPSSETFSRPLNLSL